MSEAQFKRLAEIVLTQQLIICSVQKTLKNVYEQFSDTFPKGEAPLGAIAEFERLEGILEKIENEENPRDRKFFGLEALPPLV